VGAHLGGYLPFSFELTRAAAAGGKRALHEDRTPIGFREPTVTADGFYLNGRRVKLLG
jgi:beta-galactosidase/beta-glucuronidase